MKIELMTVEQQTAYNEALARSKYADLEPKFKDIFSKTIGFENAINRKQLFAKCFGSTNKYTGHHIYFLWQRIVSAMSKMRKRTFYYVCNSKDDMGETYYYLPVRASEVEQFKNKLKAFSKGCLKSSERATQAVRQRFYKKLD